MGLGGGDEGFMRLQGGYDFIGLVFYRERRRLEFFVGVYEDVGRGSVRKLERVVLLGIEFLAFGFRVFSFQRCMFVVEVVQFMQFRFGSSR